MDGITIRRFAVCRDEITVSDFTITRVYLNNEGFGREDGRRRTKGLLTDNMTKTTGPCGCGTAVGDEARKLGRS
jgi:hypothetical protein